MAAASRVHVDSNIRSDRSHTFSILKAPIFISTKREMAPILRSNGALELTEEEAPGERVTQPRVTDCDMALEFDFIKVSYELDRSGLLWRPEIGDEVAERESLDHVSIFVDPQGLTPSELRQFFVWLPTVEQLVAQFEARQAMIYHAGISETLEYETVIRAPAGVIEAKAPSLRLAFGRALYNLLSPDAAMGGLH